MDSGEFKVKRLPIEKFAELFILEDGNPLKLEEWQEEEIIKPIFHTLDPDGRRRYNLALVGLPKKNGKSTLASLVALYMLLCDDRDPEVYSAAGSQAQAAIIHRQVSRAIQRSPLLAGEVKINTDNIVRRDGRGFYRVLSSEAPQVHGLNPSCVILDEVWNQPNYALYEALTTSPARPEPLTLAITYAGYRPYAGEVAWDLYERGLSGVDPRMFFYWASGREGNRASWVTEEYLRQQESRLPPHIFQRLHLNQWTTGEGSLLSREDIMAAVDPGLSPVFSGNNAYRYHLSLDLGLRRDSTALAICHRDKGVVYLDLMKTWTAPKGGEVQVDEVERYILDLKRSFNFATMVFDPYQSESLKQRLQAKGLPISVFNFSGASWPALTMNLLGLFKDRRVRLYQHDGLIRELQTVSIVEQSYGYKLQNSKAGTHDDMVVSLAMASLKAMEGAESTCGIFTAPSVTGELLYQKDFGISPPPEPDYNVKSLRQRAEEKAGKTSSGVWSNEGHSFGGMPDDGVW